jgi:nucleoside-diphosphate-sugar epimerase
MSKGKVTVLGINGHIGHHAAQQFLDAGWDVTGFGRSNRHPVAGVRFVKGDAVNVADLEGAIEGADVVVQALHLPYDKWTNGRAEAQLANVIEAMGNSGKTLLFPGTIYNYAATDRYMTPSTPQHPHAPRGAIRVRLEQMLEAASKAGKFQTIILRAGDFYAPDNKGDWFEQAMMMNVNKGKIYHLANLSLGHAWAYLPDLGAAFAKLAEQRESFGAFENFHFAGHYVTHAQMMSAIQKAAPVKLTPRPMPWYILQAMGLAMPVMRDIVKMRYLWNNEMELVDPRLDAILGPDFGTPFEAAVAATIRQFFPARQAA